MGFKCGIVGLPNVGKSTLFNALTADRGGAGGELSVLHDRAECRRRRGARPAARQARGDRQVGARSSRRGSTFVDIAGLVRGASKGEGLGNQFLANIREVDAIAHVLRCFEDGDVTHVEGRIDPVADAETVETELMLADLDSLERRVDAAREEARAAATRKPRRSSTLMEPALGAAARRQAGAAVERKLEPTSSAGSRQLQPADLEAGALRLQCRRRLGRDRQRPSAAGRRARAEAKARGAVGHLGRDRGRARAAAGRRAARNSSQTLGLTSRASTG